jgi:hypothetical protein
MARKYKSKRQSQLIATRSLFLKNGRDDIKVYIQVLKD